ncbi:MAG: VanZ family protein [Pyrinomonadaceae bacterium]
MKFESLPFGKSVEVKPTTLAKGLAICYAVAILTAIALYDNKSTSYLFFKIATVQYLDKIVHFFALGSFSFIVNLAFEMRSVALRRFKISKGTLLILTFATLEEFSQIFMTTRSFELSDLASNTIGIILFAEIARLVYNYLTRESSVEEQIMQPSE